MSIPFFYRCTEVHHRTVVAFLKADGWSGHKGKDGVVQWRKGDESVLMPALGRFDDFGDASSSVGYGLVEIAKDHGWCAVEVWKQVIEGQGNGQG